LQEFRSYRTGRASHRGHGGHREGFAVGRREGSLVDGKAFGRERHASGRASGRASHRGQSRKSSSLYRCSAVSTSPTVYRKNLPFPKTAYGRSPSLSTYSVTPELLQLLNSFPPCDAFPLSAFLAPRAVVSPTEVPALKSELHPLANSRRASDLLPAGKVHLPGIKQTVRGIPVCLPA
jgi:hypothetical protein